MSQLEWLMRHPMFLVGQLMGYALIIIAIGAGIRHVWKWWLRKFKGVADPKVKWGKPILIAFVLVVLLGVLTSI